jgi:two-component system response regulator RegX3
LPRILIVDDDPGINKSLSSSLQLHGFEIKSVKNESEAVAAIQSFQPAIILIDVNLPGTDWQELCRRIRASSRVPIILITTQDEEMDRVHGLEAGADDYIIKPYFFRELLARIRARLRRVDLDHESLQNESISIGEISLDPHSRQVHKYGEEIELSTREFELLEMLMRHAGRALSREELLLKAWGEESVEDFRKLFVYIHWLRAKIEDNPAAPHYIRNVRRYGYRFIALDET